jgi:hypothetical protein
MSNVIKVLDTTVVERTINGKNGQQVLRSQRAALDLGGGYSLPFRVELGTGPVHPVGDYTIDPQCFALNQYGDLTLGRVKIVPLAAPRVAAPAARG